MTQTPSRRHRRIAGIWAPDGRKIAYAADPEGPPDLYVLDLATSGSERIHAAPEVLNTRGWAPHEGVLSQPRGDDRLYSIDSGTPGATPEVVVAGISAEEIALSPDRR